MWPFKKKEEDSQAAAVKAHDHMRRIGRWHLDEKVLGEGGYGKVVRAFDFSLQPPLVAACKTIDTRRMKRAAIEREVRIAQKLSHRNIAAVLDYVVAEPLAHVFLEYCGGGELFEKVISAGPAGLPEATARAYFAELCAGTAHCHSRGVVHRDLKLENVMLTDKGVLKIIDFGLAAEYEPLPDGSFAMATLYETCGSKSYAAPEVLSGRGYTGFGADVWSCGICLFAMLAGFFPLDEATNRDWRYQRVYRAETQGLSITQTIYAFYQRPCPLSREAVALLDGMLELSPSKRLSLDAVLQSAWLTGARLPAPAPAASGNSAGAPLGRGSAGASGGAPSAVLAEEGPHYRSLGSHAALSRLRLAEAQPGGERCAEPSGDSLLAAISARVAAGCSVDGSAGGEWSGDSEMARPADGQDAGGPFGGLLARGQLICDEDDEPVYRSLAHVPPPPQLARQPAFERYEPAGGGNAEGARPRAPGSAEDGGR